MEFIEGGNYKILFIKKSKPNIPIIEQILRENKDCVGFAVAGEIDGIIIYSGNGEYTLLYSNINILDDSKWNYTFLRFKLREDLEIPNKYRTMIFRGSDEYLILQQHSLMREVDSLWEELYQINPNITEDKTYCVFRIFKN